MEGLSIEQKKAIKPVTKKPFQASDKIQEEPLI